MDATNMSRYVVWDTNSLPNDSETVTLIGGKALGLHHLKALGVPVPPWATLSTLFLRHVCEGDTDLQRLLAAECAEIPAKAGLIRDHLKNMPISENDGDLLRTVWEKISEQGGKPVAVRSSAADEDSVHLSFAGQMESFLNVRDLGQFIDAVRGCWASQFGERAVFYRQKSGLEYWSLQIAVVVQQMVEPEVAGVIFTANPLTGNRGEMLVCSAWGLGEGLVSGTLTADTYVLDGNGACISRELADKRHSVASTAGGGTEKVKLTGDKPLQSTLDENRLRELHGLARTVQDSAGRPMDIEFAVSGDRIYLLQARPVTTLKESPAPEQDNFKVWDNSNIVESYAGVTTPLTFSFICKAYYAVYCQFCQMMGVDRKTVFRNRHVLENMLGFIQGRVYYNLLNWYRLISLMPGYKYNKAFMEQMMGLQRVGEFMPEREPQSRTKKYLVYFPKLLWAGFRMLVNHFTLENKIAAFHARFGEIYSGYGRLDFNRLSASRLFEIFRRLEDEVLWHWKAPILNDFEAMVFYGLLRRLTAKWQLDITGSLHNDLLCGEGGIRSTEVTTELFRLAAKIDADTSLKEAFLECRPEQIVPRLRDDPAFAAISKAFTEYLGRYGVRSINEMKLESVPVRDDPTFCISVIQNYLRSGVPDPDAMLAHERNIRREAEDSVRTSLKGKKCLWIVPKLAVYLWVLRNTRKAVRNRENQRFARSEAYDLVRRIMRALGDRWQADGILEDREDIFFLEIDEVWSFIEGTSTCPALRELVKVRKKEFAHYASTAPADHFETYGVVYGRNIFAGTEESPEESDQLKGLGCCRGTVENEVRIVVTPDADVRLDGEIMVAQQTDPGWIVLFPSISGLIVEKGSLLSHSAIVAREMGIPTVVGVPNATRILRNGDRVRLDGAAGLVTILCRAGR